MKHGRPRVYLGAGVKHLRIRYINLKGRTRGFYARWRSNLQVWECHLTGYGIKHRQWFSESQTLALHRLRMTPCLWDWRKKVIDTSVRWDGIEDTGYSVDGEGEGDLFAVQSGDPMPEPQKTLPAASKDRVKSQRGAGDASPAVTEESQVTDHGGLVVGSLPADQIELYFPVTSFKALAA